MYKIGFFLLLVLTINLACQEKKEENHTPKKTDLAKFIVGKWETVQNKYTTSYLTLDFAKNKNFTYILRSDWKCKYRLYGKHLIVKVPIAMLNKSITDTMEVDVKKDTLILKTKVKNRAVNYTFHRKRGSHKGNGIIGEWFTLHFDGHPANLTITKNGDYMVSEILRAFGGLYTVKGDHFIVHSGSTLMMNMRFQKFNDDIIIYGKGPNMRMKRIKE